MLDGYFHSNLVTLCNEMMRYFQKGSHIIYTVVFINFLQTNSIYVNILFHYRSSAGSRIPDTNSLDGCDREKVQLRTHQVGCF